MTENNEIYKSLGQVPELVKLAQKQSQNIENLSKMVAQAIQRQMTAKIPEEEHQKMAQTISSTPCAAPDMTVVANELAKSMIKAVRRDIHDEAVKAVKEAIQENPVTLAKPHEYAEYIEPRLRNWALTMTILVISFVVSFIGIAIYSAHSKEHYGRLYMEEVLNSKYITKEEHDMLVQDSYVMSALPSEFKKKPKYVKKKINRWVEILEQREEEAKVNNGVFSTAIPLER